MFASLLISVTLISTSVQFAPADGGGGSNAPRSRPPASEVAPVAPVAPTTSRPAVTPAVLKQAREKLDAALRDYPATRFSGVRAYASASGEYVDFCGKMNGPNALGAMTGWQTFWLSGAFDGPMALILRPATECDNGDRLSDEDYSSSLSAER